MWVHLIKIHYICVGKCQIKTKVFLKISEIILIRLKSIKSVYPISLFGFQTMQGKWLLVKGTDHISLTT